MIDVTNAHGTVCKTFSVEWVQPQVNTVYGKLTLQTEAVPTRDRFHRIGRTDAGPPNQTKTYIMSFAYLLPCLQCVEPSPVPRLALSAFDKLATTGLACDMLHSAGFIRSLTWD